MDYTYALSFKAEWSDGFVESNNVGAFSRTFQNNQSIPASVTVIVSGTENIPTTIIVQIPESSFANSTTSERLQNFSDVTFSETGLPPESNWSVTLNGITMYSLSAPFYSRI